VPVLIVTPSRISQSSPIVRRVAPPRYFTDCGGVPSEQKGATAVRAPIVVQPVTFTWLSRRHASPMTTFGPTTQ
jgi:hypothetical protein